MLHTRDPRTLLCHGIATHPTPCISMRCLTPPPPQDSYTSPGSPVLRKNALDRYVLMVIDPKEGEMGGR